MNRVIENMTVFSSFGYSPSLSKAILAAKNGSRRGILQQLALKMSEDLIAFGPGGFDAVTWIPSSRVRRRQRGYDQGKIIAKIVSRSMGMKANQLLLRTAKGDVRQLGQTRLQRLEGPELVAPNNVPSSILVVDDVITTGSSLAAASRALRERGASHLVAATIASVEATAW